MLKVVAVARCRGGGGLGYHRAPALLWCAVTASSRHRLFSTSLSRRNPDASLADIRNIGIIAHVDAGKTTTTERMLYYSGLTRHLGNVDHGDTVTDFLPLERERGITIQSAAITFNWPLAEDCPEGTHPKTINLIDTPGHQDFRFEVDRCLPVLDGAVCIIDSVKGVEAHTERVWSSAQQFKIPRIVYVNKLDRDGASFKRSVLDIASKLNCFPLVCQLPWWDNDSLIGVIDVIEKKAIRYNSADNYQVYQGETLSSVLQSNAALLQEISTARDRLIERLCEYDDELVEEFADKGNDLPAESIKKSIRRLILTGEGEVAPVFAGSSLRNMGVQPLLDAVVDYLPSPQDTADVEVLLSGEKHQLQDVLQRKIPGLKPKPSTAHKPPIEAVASVFKVVNDPSLRDATRGMMSFVRVYHGTLNRNSQVWNANLGCFEKSLRMVQISASKTADVPHLSRGQIGALIGLKDARTGDTLQILPSHSHRSPDQALRSMQIRPPDIPAAVAFLAIHPFSDTGRDHLQQCLEKASREDPSLRWNRDEKHDRFVLSGMGKLHLEIAIHRLKTQYKVDAAFGDIEVDYKECLTAPTGEHRYEYDRVVASKAGKAACVASLEPRDQHDEASILESSTERDGNLFHIKIVLPDDGELPIDPELVRKQLFNGAYAAMARGPRRGSPMHSCCVSITFDPETDFFGPGTDGHIVNAAYNAVRTALNSAHSQSAVGILEPVMKANISCPEEAAGTIQHDIASARGGQVLEVNDANVASADSIIDLNEVYAPPDPYESLQSLRDAKKGVTRMLDIVAKVPLKEMLDYDSLLRSKTGGRHSLTMSLDTFDRVTGPREKGL